MPHPRCSRAQRRGAEPALRSLAQRARSHHSANGAQKPEGTHFEPITWDDAFALIAQTLRSLGSPNEAVFYTSGKAVNESAFVFQLFARAFGTNNLPDCSNMCHESSGLALQRNARTSARARSRSRIWRSADCILEIGHNPGTNHPRMLTSLQIAKKRGAKIIAVNPLPEVSLFRFAHPQKPWQWLGSGTALADLTCRCASTATSHW